VFSFFEKFPTEKLAIQYFIKLKYSNSTTVFIKGRLSSKYLTVKAVITPSRSSKEQSLKIKRMV